jgi:glycosyltransferase involved in cell wall biosynthesis
MSKLTIISHTEHYKCPDGSIVGFGPTVTEINHLLGIFDEIQHVAMLHNENAPLSALPYVSDRITFVALPAIGGKKISDKLNIVLQAPKVLGIVKRAINQSDYFQFRSPTGIGVYVVPYLVFISKSKGWFKYAGNWKQSNPPMAYSFQRWLLKHQKRKVTINGNWPNIPRQCIAFENPCLTNDELQNGITLVDEKGFVSSKVTFCFVGRLEKEKGIDVLIASFKVLDNDEKSKIEAVHIVGDSINRTFYEKTAENCGVDFIFHGNLSRTNVHNIYKKSHAIVLPSASEGFPKVISEAMNYGCLPIVSNISSISNYITDDKNGYLIDSVSRQNVLVNIRKLLNLEISQFQNMIKMNSKNVSRFSYNHYNYRIESEVL